MMSTLRSRRIRKSLRAVDSWWHSIDLGDGVVTPGVKGLDQLRGEWDALELPDLRGRSVLDVGAWDGWFAFEAERRGASRVCALDHYVWSLDLAACRTYEERCWESGESPRPYHEVPGLWHPNELPGKRGFDVARRVLGSEVEDVCADFESLDPTRLGAFDVVLFLGVLYHLRDPLGALTRLARVTDELAVIETQAIHVPGLEGLALWEFYPSAELGGDPNNWWAPNLPALQGACLTAGFDGVEVVIGPGEEVTGSGERLVRYRATVHARKGTT